MSGYAISIAFRAGVRGITLGAVLILEGACSNQSQGAAPVVPFKALFEHFHVVPLNATVEHPIGFATSALVTNVEIALLDRTTSDIKVFARRDGSLIRIVGKPGDDAGQFRSPNALAPLDSGRYVVYDQGRRVLSIRDSLGRVISEAPMAKGAFGGLVALPKERRVVLAGRMSDQTGDTKDVDLHEFDFSGRRIASYATTAKTSSELEARFNALFAVQVGQQVVTGSLSSNRLRIYDRTTGHAKWIEVASSWYRPLEYPPRATSNAGTQSTMPWTHTQPFMNGIFALTGGRFLVRFQAFTSLQDKAFYYAVADTSGVTRAISQATRANVVASRGDTIFWVNGGGKTPASLGFGVVDVPPVSGRARLGPAARALAGR